MTTRADVCIAGKRFRQTRTTSLRGPRTMHFIDGRPVSAATFADQLARARVIEAVANAPRAADPASDGILAAKAEAKARAALMEVGR